MKISISELSKLTGKDRRSISRKLEGLTAEKEGTAHLYESKAALLLIYAGRSEDGDHLDLTQERAALARTQRKLADLKIREIESGLISVDAIKQHLGEMAANARRVMLGLPSKLAPVLATMEKPPEIYKILSDEIRNALYYLSEKNIDETPYHEFRRREK